MAKFIFLLFVIFVSTASQAAERVDIFVTEVEVESQSVDERNEHFPEAMRQVLFKVTGLNQFDSYPDAESLIEEAERYVLSFGYRQNQLYIDRPVEADIENAENSPLIDESVPESEPALPYLLRVEFSPVGLESRLREIGMPIWGSLRPSIISWIVIQRAGQRDLLSAELLNEARIFERQASHFGLPLFLPVGDLQDQSNVSLNELWGLFDDSVFIASKRYPSDGHMLARVYEADEGLELKWLLILGSEQFEGRVKARDYQALWQLMNSDILSFMAERYAVADLVGADAREIVVRVSQVDSFVDYAQVVDLISSMSSVESALLKRLSGDDLDIEVALRGTVAAFEQQVALVGQLTPRMLDRDFAQEIGKLEGPASFDQGEVFEEQLSTSDSKEETNGISGRNVYVDMESPLDTKSKVDLHYIWKSRTGN